MEERLIIFQLSLKRVNVFWGIFFRCALVCVGFSWLESRQSRYNLFTAFQRQFTTEILCKSCCLFSILFQYGGLGVVNSVKMTDGHLHSKQQRKRLSFVSLKEMLYFDKWNLSLLYLSVICKHLFYWKP